MLACLNQIRVVDYRRFKNKLGDLDELDFANICDKINLVFQKNQKNKSLDSIKNKGGVGNPEIHL